jgi:hypothetical protein
MPGLIRGVARTAVVAGTATAVSGRVQRRQAERNAERDAQIYADRRSVHDEERAAAAAPPPPRQAEEPDPLSQLERLGALRQQGLLTDEEFAEQKARLLGT